MALTLIEANQVIQAALTRAREMNIRISVAVCDAGGRLIAFNRMDGASWASAYGSQGKEGAASANRALTLALSTLLRLFAPFLPYVTDEVWSWWQDGSVHRASWPTVDEVHRAAGAQDGSLVLDVVAAIVAEVRRAKTEAKQSLRAEVARATVRDTAERLAALQAAEADIKEAGHIADLVTEEADEFSVDVELGGS